MTYQKTVIKDLSECSNFEMALYGVKAIHMIYTEIHKLNKKDYKINRKNELVNKYQVLRIAGVQL